MAAQRNTFHQQRGRVAHRLSSHQRPGRRAVWVSGALWSVEAVLVNLRQKRFEPKTVERVYEADVYPAVFDFDSWTQHRSRGRYLEHCITLFRSYFFRDLLAPLAVLVGAAVAVGLYETGLRDGLLPGWLPDIEGVSDTPFQLTSFALSLMLVFRTNSSYARWLDARQQWGLIVNTARTFVRQALTTLPESSCGELRAAVGRWTIAFVRLGKLHLREHGDVKREVKDLLLGEEVPLVVAASHRPLVACHVLSELLRSAEAGGRLSEVARMRLEADVSAMSQALGACEKILRNPIPLSYTRHTSRFLILWLLWLPMALWGKVGWCVVPVEAVMTYLLLGIDEIAIQMEEPFGILPLENMCEAAQQSIEQLLNMDHVVQGVVASYACAAVPAAPAATAAATNPDGGRAVEGAASESPPPEARQPPTQRRPWQLWPPQLEPLEAAAAAQQQQQQQQQSTETRQPEFNMPSDRC
ncbi:hypothetical protein PLESTB_000943600 [Pleodorina starrii]|uniref:Uncharacterized protein n=1 Tax=Pleodorina starrii TaxID=330485 RepID=A0A9W6BN11_9CHLO|nr:hypothetical protein PLESTM_001155100 [Pleodorina starrii]GLC55099.1 hypothetical protein PLESTB_000943600 [Pleodorina starrii]GLC71147.1 hypothetical protein PLESTF_001079600 [Pleodorina starrii]